MTNRFLELEARLTRRRPSNGTPVVAMSGGLPAIRKCCALWWNDALDPKALRGHRYGTADGPTGYVYTATTGLIDLGHLRDMTDMVKYVDDQLAAGSPKFALHEGEVEPNRIPPDAGSRLDLAGAITYVESWAHEVATWGTSQDFSSFSPEDIPSNICGVEVGKRAITMGGPFDAAVDDALDHLLNAEMGARPRADTEAVLSKVKQHWLTGLTGTRLARRNFTSTGWMAAMPFDAAQSLPWLSIGVFEPYYHEFKYTMKKAVNGSKPTLATMQATTDALRTAWLAANAGGDENPLR